MANDEDRKPPELTEAQGKVPLRLRDIEWMMEAVAKGVNEAIAKATQPLQRRIAELESRQVKYCGVWYEGKVYGAGSMVTDHGSIWHAERATLMRPGSSTDWVLAVRRGAPGKSTK